MAHLSDKSVLVVGASSGIGQGLAEYFAKIGKLQN